MLSHLFRSAKFEGGDSHESEDWPHTRSRLCRKCILSAATDRQRWTSGGCQGHLTVPKNWHLLNQSGPRLGTPRIDTYNSPRSSAPAIWLALHKLQLSI